MSSKKKKTKSAPKSPAKRPQPVAHRDSVYDWADNLVFAGTLLILFLRPFLSGRTYPQYNHFFHIGVGLMAILWLVKCWRKKVLELHNRLLTGFMIFFLFACSITFFTTINKGVTLRYIYEILTYTMLFLIIANNFREETSVKIAVAGILAASLLVNCYGLFQRYYSLEMTRRYIETVIESGEQTLLMGVPLGTGILHRLESTRVFSTFLFPNAYALFLGIAGGLTLGWIWSMHRNMVRFAGGCWENLRGRTSAGIPVSGAGSKGGWEARILKGIGGLLLIFLFLASCVLIPWNLLLTYSRGGWLTALAILVVFAVVKFRGKNGFSEKVVLVILAAALFATLFPPVEAISAETLPVREVSVFSRLKETFTIVQRLSYWKATLAMIRDNPWFGVGWGAFEKAYPRYMILGGYPVKLAHNNYLQVWAETGLVGLNAFAGLWLVFFYTFWRKVGPESAVGMRGIACGLGAGVVGFLVNSMTDIALYLPTLAYLVFALLGLLVAVPMKEKDENKFSIRFPALAGAILIVMMGVYLSFLYRSYAGLKLLHKVETERNVAFPTSFAKWKGFEADPEFQRRTLRNCIPSLKESIKYFPLDADSHHMLGDTCLRLSQMENAPSLLTESIRHLERAAELNPWSSYVFESLATAYWAAGNTSGQPEMFQKALEAEQQASENFPVNPDYHDKLRRIYEALGLEEQARKEAILEKELRKHYKEI